MHAHYELPSVVSPRIGATQEVVHASLGYEQSKLIPSHSTLASMQCAADHSTWWSVVETTMLYDRRATP